MSFENKVVLVTGASSGIGASIAVLFSKEKANIVLVARNETKLQSVASRCVSKCLTIKADVSVEADVKAVVERTLEEFGGIDVLVNNAGIVRYGSIGMGNILTAYDEVFATNLRGLIHLTSLCAEHLVVRKGNIVNISSVGGLIAPKKPILLPYCMSKAALNLFTQGVALELGEHGVRVNTVSPGPVETDIILNSGVPAEMVSWKKFEDETLLNRVGEPEEIAELVLFLASDKARGITGANYISDNGFLLKR
ncbi:meso-2,3-butanediol dehydrogenase-like [Battus philenor]|uniref:meso-2,3-butanediol dehydrogenase-like n=1 Tax=Battus philenor TaxID=42288 RepID=UPI0035D0E986